jgi:hypothetical protein
MPVSWFRCLFPGHNREIVSWPMVHRTQNSPNGQINQRARFDIIPTCTDTRSYMRQPNRTPQHKGSRARAWHDGEPTQGTGNCCDEMQRSRETMDTDFLWVSFPSATLRKLVR